MGAARAALSGRRTGVLIALAACAIWLAPSLAIAATVADLCGQPAAAPTSNPNPASAATLAEATALAEQRLAAGDAPQGDAQMKTLAAAIDPGAATGAPLPSLAGYCTAAGELVRRGWIESPLS